MAKKERTPEEQVKRDKRRARYVLGLVGVLFGSMCSYMAGRNDPPPSAPAEVAASAPAALPPQPKPTAAPTAAEQAIAQETSAKEAAEKTAAAAPTEDDKAAAIAKLNSAFAERKAAAVVDLIKPIFLISRTPVCTTPDEVAIAIAGGATQGCVRGTRPMPVAAFLDAYPEGNVAYIRLARNGRVGEFFAPYGALTNNPARTEAAHEALMLAVKRATDAGVKPSDVDE